MNDGPVTLLVVDDEEAIRRYEQQEADEQGAEENVFACGIN